MCAMTSLPKHFMTVHDSHWLVVIKPHYLILLGRWNGCGLLEADGNLRLGQRERLKMSVNAPASWSASALGTQPVPVTFCRFILRKTNLISEMVTMGTVGPQAIWEGDVIPSNFCQKLALTTQSSMEKDALSPAILLNDTLLPITACKLCYNQQLSVWLTWDCSQV